MRTTSPAAFALWVAPIFVLAAVAFAARTGVPRADEQELARRLPAPDLALASGSRQLRMPSLEEPWAAFHDSPGTLDADPAGGFFLPREAAP